VNFHHKIRHRQSVRMFRSRLENFVCDGLEDVDREVFRLSGCQNDGDLA
jgi:hypothetical protein